ncbi:MAG: DUF3306 domain-containing protein [Rhizobiales bacterium]|nr:DUF3306 domain-containing protein [Hyphomicrobiales bacterium]
MSDSGPDNKPEKPRIGEKPGDDEQFMSRWARRKAEISSGETPLEPDEIAAQEEAAEALEQARAKTLDEMSDEELLEEFDLPDPDTMETGDDFSVFMKKAIPSRLKNRALRRLWLSNPALANLDMLVDYGDDFTDAAMVVPNMKTIYQVGKGIVRKVEEVLENIEENSDDESDSEDQEDGLEEDGVTDEGDADEALVEAEEEAELAPPATITIVELEPELAGYEPQTGSRDRMKFKV